MPSTWKQGNRVADLTFKELLSQYSGMWIILVNSLGTYGSTHTVVADAFDAAWK